MLSDVFVAFYGNNVCPYLYSCPCVICIHCIYCEILFMFVCEIKFEKERKRNLKKIYFRVLKGPQW